MKRKEVYQILRKRHPEATNIAPNEFNLWDVDIEEEFVITTLTYKAEGTGLRFIGEMIVEQ
jgi:hypothetical protein